MGLIKQRSENFYKDIRGTFSIYLAVAFSTLLIGIGCAYDMSQATSQSAKIQDLADSTALAAAIAARTDKKNREQRAEDFYELNRQITNQLTATANPIIDFNDDDKDVKVEVSAVYQYSFMGIFGFADPTITRSATAGFMIDKVAPISLVFALDVSSSMTGITTDGVLKIDALKKATDDLFKELEDATERKDLLEQSLSTGYSNYTDVLGETRSIQEGYEDTLEAILDMQTGFGTNSVPSLEYTLNQLNAWKATETDPAWKGVVVFMTDGDNYSAQRDADSIAHCTEMKAAGYEIYAVAFEAPAVGKALLQACASDLNHYYDSADAAALRESFKLIGKRLGSSTIVIKS